MLARPLALQLFVVQLSQVKFPAVHGYDSCDLLATGKVDVDIDPLVYMLVFTYRF